MRVFGTLTADSFIVDAEAFEEGLGILRGMSLAINFLDFVVEFGIFFEQFVDDMLVFLSLSRLKRVIFNDMVTAGISKILETQFFN
jgi:hypothetical protein